MQGFSSQSPEDVCDGYSKQAVGSLSQLSNFHCYWEKEKKKVTSKCAIFFSMKWGVLCFAKYQQQALGVHKLGNT